MVLNNTKVSCRQSLTGKHKGIRNTPGMVDHLWSRTEEQAGCLL